MTSTSFNGMIDLIITGIGFYILYNWSQMKATGEIRGGMFLPKGIDPRHCKDPKGYMAYMSPRFLFLGILALLSGVIGLIADYTGLVPSALYLLVMGVFFVALIWYASESKKAIRKYWGLK